MKKLSMTLLADTVIRQRKEKQMTQKQLSELTGINRAMISRLEKQDYQPSIPQLETLGEVLDFEPISMFVKINTFFYKVINAARDQWSAAAYITYDIWNLPEWLPPGKAVPAP